MTETITKPKRITLATFKSFVRKNRHRLFVRFDSRFDGMIDCVSYNDNPVFVPAKESTRPDMVSHDLGIGGVYLIGRNSSDRFKEFETEEFAGFTYYNCCGSGAIAVRK